ncbi:Protein of unknown function [Gryllus bimaculatus]|nr:Protein of unknown function [Gryllus bimaculatus]
MEEVHVLSESIIKIEPIKEEPIDVNKDNCWNAFLTRLGGSSFGHYLNIKMGDEDECGKVQEKY